MTNDQFSGRPSAGATALPEEIVDHIASYLERKDVHQLRLTCKALHAQSQHQFAVKHFRVSRFMITKESLETLVEFSKDPKIGPAIKAVELVLVVFPECMMQHISVTQVPDEPRQQTEPDGGLLDGLIEGSLNDPSERQKQYRRKVISTRRRIHRRHQNSQNTMRTKGVDVALLTEAFRHLSALESIAIRDQYDRDEPPWGARKLMREVDVWPATASVTAMRHNFSWIAHQVVHRAEVYKPFGVITAHSMGLVLGAIHRSGIKLKSLRFDGAPHTLAFMKTPAQHRISRTSTPGKTFAASQIEDLRSAFSEIGDFQVNGFEYEEPRFREYQKFNIVNPFQWLLKYLQLMPSLQQLSIVGGGAPQDPLFRNMALEGLHFPKLRRLVLRYTRFGVSDLCKIFEIHRQTLEEFSAEDCDPLGADYLHMLKMITSLPVLRSIHLFNLVPTRPYWYARQPVPRDLPGIGGTQFLLDEDSPVNFRPELHEKITAIEIADSYTAVGTT